MMWQPLGWVRHGVLKGVLKNHHLEVHIYHVHVIPTARYLGGRVLVIPTAGYLGERVHHLLVMDQRFGVCG
jgi:hypothetical protein